MDIHKTMLIHVEHNIQFLQMFQNVILFAALMMPGFILGKLNQFERASVTTITNILTKTHKNDSLCKFYTLFIDYRTR